MLGKELAEKQKDLKRAEHAHKALQWLGQYGPTAAKDNELQITIKPAFATSCTGVEEAVDYLERAAGRLSEAVLTSALESARADLAKVFPDGGGER